MITKTFVFTVHLTGRGGTEAEAWQDAVEAFTLDPGDAAEAREDSSEEE